MANAEYVCVEGVIVRYELLVLIVKIEFAATTTSWGKSRTKSMKFVGNSVLILTPPRPIRFVLGP